MNVLRALLLSSQSKAELFECDPRSGLLIAPPRVLYRLVAAHRAVLSPDAKGDIWTLSIYRADYPDSKVGKGWGEPHFAGKAHKTCQFEDKGDFYNYLRRFCFSPENGWRPVEDETDSLPTA